MNVIIAVDISYSMGGYINKVVDGINNFLLKLKKISDRPVYLTIITFNTHVNYIIKSVNVNMIDKFYLFQFNCFGMTSLYDAIGQIFLDFGLHSKCQSYIFIISDGEDNSSKIYNKQIIDGMLSVAQNNNWKILHCHTDANILDVPTITYKQEDITSLFENLSI
jgi:uncharacterized protein YegL